MLYNANGFLADFQRAQNNAGARRAAGCGYNGTYNADVAGSVPLTVFPLLGSGGNLDQRDHTRPTCSRARWANWPTSTW